MCVCVCVWEYISSTYQACLEPQLQVWVQAAGAGGPPCTFFTEVGDWVPRLGSCDVQWKLFDTLIEGNCESSFLFTTKHIVIRSAGPYQGVADAMGSSQMHSSHKYSSEWKSLFPGLSMTEGSAWDWEKRQESIFHGCGCEENAAPISKFKMF